MSEDPIAGPKLDRQPLQESAASLVSKETLQLEQLRLTNDKLSLEAQKLAREAAPARWWSNLAQNVVAVGGVLTVAATAYGLYDSYNKTLTARLSAQVTEQRTQFEDAIKKLESNNTVSKLVAVSILSGYLGEKDRSFHRQILFTFAGVAATESDPQAQAAILDLMTAQDPGAITASDWSYFQDMLVSQSRALVSKGNLYEERQFGIKDVAPSKDEQAARHVGSLIALLVRKGVVPDYSNYRGIYCEGCNLREAKFAKNASFVTAVLDRADFRGSTLEGASFDNAALDGTVFAGAYLKDATFRTLAENHLADGRSTTVIEAMRNRLVTPRLQQIQSLLQSHARVRLTMPDFSCSNLQNAVFDNFALFKIPDSVRRSFTRGDEVNGGWRKTVDDRLIPRNEKAINFKPFESIPPSFYRADLGGARLSEIRVFMLVNPAALYVAHEYLKQAITVGTTELAFWEGLPSDRLLSLPPLEPDGTRTPLAAADVFESDQADFQSDLRFAFLEANLSGAGLPNGFSDILKIKFPPQFDLRRGFQSRYPSSGELDWNCKTRVSP